MNKQKQLPELLGGKKNCEHDMSDFAPDAKHGNRPVSKCKKCNGTIFGAGRIKKTNKKQK